VVLTEVPEHLLEKLRKGHSTEKLAIETRRISEEELKNLKKMIEDKEKTVKSIEMPEATIEMQKAKFQGPKKTAELDKEREKYMEEKIREVISNPEHEGKKIAIQMGSTHKPSIYNLIKKARSENKIKVKEIYPEAEKIPGRFKMNFNPNQQLVRSHKFNVFNRNKYKGEKGEKIKKEEKKTLEKLSKEQMKIFNRRRSPKLAQKRMENIEAGKPGLSREKESKIRKEVEEEAVNESRKKVLDMQRKIKRKARKYRKEGLEEPEAIKRARKETLGRDKGKVDYI